MTRKNKKARFRLSPIACALALSFAFGAAPTVHAYETIPIVSDTGVPYIHFNVLTPGEWHSVYDDFNFYDPVDRDLRPEELTGLELGTDYFWQLLRDSYAAQGPINILLMPYAVRDDNASALSPYGPTLMTDLGSAWCGLSTDLSKTAAYITVDSAIFNWYTDELPVLPHQAKDTDLPGTILHELFHAFGLTSAVAAVEIDGESWIVFPSNDTNLYTLHLHDLTGRSMAQIMEESGEDAILVNVVTPGRKDEIINNQFNIYFNDRDSGAYFSAKHVDEVLDGAKIAWPIDVYDVQHPNRINEAARAPVPGLPINGLEGGGRVFDTSHIELQNSLMSHQSYRNWCVLMEAEIALLQDIGYDIDRRRFYGYSIYNNDLSFDNPNPYWARKDDGSGWIVGEPSQQEWGIGLHIYGSNNKVTQIAPLMSDGKWGIGTRVDGVANDLTIASGTVVQANGVGGKGILFSWGKNHNLTIEEGATVRAMGENGIGVSFDFGSNEMGDYWGYLGSYTGIYEDQLMKDVPEALQGALVKNFTVNGKVEGKLASIYISPNAFVENIVIAPGAEIKGDIISLWDPEETIYGLPHLYDGKIPLETRLFFGTYPDSESKAATLSVKSAGSKIVFNDDIVGADSINLGVNGTTLVMTGTADVLTAAVWPESELQGGHFRLHTEEPFVNAGSLVSTQANPVVIEGDYLHFEDDETKASLTLSVQDGKIIPLSVSGTSDLPASVTVHGSPEGTWQASGKVKAPAASAVVTTQSNPVDVDFSWRDPSEYVASPTMSFSQTADGALVAKRAPQAYSSRMTGESKVIGEIFDQSAEHLTTDSSKALFAAMDWSDMSGKTIAEAGRALMGDGLEDGTAAALQFERAAQMALDPSLPFTEPEGDYAWVKPVGGTSKVRSIGTVRTDIAGLTGGMIRKDADGEAGISVAALTARGDASTIDDYNAKGIWVSAYSRAENIFGSPLFAKGSVRLGYINSDEDRVVHYAGMTDKTEADVDRWSLGLSAHTGRAFDLAETVRIEPYAGFEGFIHYVPSYEEDADGAAAMHAASALYRSLEAQVGVKLEGAVFEPNRAFWQVHAAYGRELMPDAGDMRLSFAASDLRGNFKRAVDFDSKNRVRAGAKVGLQNKEGFTLNARLDYERESSSSAILTGGIEAQWRF